MANNLRSTSLSCLPSHLFGHICQYLDLVSKITLRSCARSFGGHSLDDLVTGLRIPLDRVDLCKQPLLLANLQRMGRLTHLHLVPSSTASSAPEDMEPDDTASDSSDSEELSTSGSDACDEWEFPKPDSGSNLGDGPSSDEETAAADLARPCQEDPEVPEQSVSDVLRQQQQQQHQEQQRRQQEQELDQTLQLMTQFVVPSRSLTTLTLDGLSTSSVHVAAQCLVSASPNVVRLKLADITGSKQLTAPQHDQLPCGWDTVWAAMSRAVTLRRLTIRHQTFEAGELDGLERLTQLQRLCMDNWQMDGGDERHDIRLPNLGALQELKAVPRGSFCYRMLHLRTLTGLRLLELHGCDMDTWLQSELPTTLPALSRLTRLVIAEDVIGGTLVLPCLPKLFAQPSISLLAELNLRQKDLCMEDVTGLVRLTSLTCSNLALPQVSSAVCMPELRRLACTYLKPSGGVAPADTANAAVTPAALLFPALTSLHCLRDLDASYASRAPPQYIAWYAKLWQGAPMQLLLELSYSFQRWEMDMPLTMALACVALRSLALTFACALGEVKLTGSLPALRVLGHRVADVELRWARDSEFTQVLQVFPDVPKMSIFGPYDHAFDRAWIDISDSAFKLLPQLRCLRHITIVRCKQITASSMMALANQSSTQHISLQGCPLIEVEDVQRIRQAVGRPWLDVEVLSIPKVVEEPEDWRYA